MTKNNNLSRQFRAPFLLFLFALGLRLIFWALSNKYFPFHENLSSDAAYYQDWAREIAWQNWIGDKIFYGLPLYAYFLAVLERLTLSNDLLIRFINIFLGSFNCSLTYLLANQIFSDKRIALFSGFFIAISYPLIHYDWIISPVPLLISLSLIILILLTKEQPLSTPQDFLSLGLLIGLLALGDGKILIFLLLALVFLIYQHRRSGITAISTKILSILIGCSLIVGAVAVRNKVVGGSWVPITAQTGLSFYVGNHEGSKGIYQHPEFLRPTHGGQDTDQVIVAQSLSGSKLTDSEVSRFWADKAFLFIAKDPQGYLQLLCKKTAAFFQDNELAWEIDLILQRDWFKRFDLNPFVFFMPLAILGMFITRGSSQKLVYLNFMISSQLLFTLIFFLNHRHRLTIYPLLAIYESFALLWIFQKIKEKKLLAAVLSLIFVISAALALKTSPMDQRDVDFLEFSKTGKMLDEKKDYQNAQDEYEKALNIYPNDTDSLFNLATVYLNTNRLPEAERGYLKVLEINPHEIDTLFNLGVTYKRMGQLSKAAALFDKVISYDDMSLDAHLQIAQIYQSSGNCSKANDHYQKIIDIKPQFFKDVRKLIEACR